MAYPQQGAKQQTPQGGMVNPGGKILCNDQLSTEKYVSGTYDTGVFEAACPTVRQALLHIQQDEQLFNYMNSHGIHNVQ